MKLWLLRALAFIAGPAAVAAAPSIPSLVNYQGRLANADGTPFPTADYELRVALYDAATNGNLVWGPQLFDGATNLGHGPRLPVVQGFFNAMIGPVDILGRSIEGAFDSGSRYVETAVSNRSWRRTWRSVWERCVARCRVFPRRST